MLDLYFNEESDYSEANTCDNEVFLPTILQPFQFESEQKKTCGNASHEKESKYIHASSADLLHVRIGNLDWSVRKASNHPAFMDICPDYWSHVLACLVDGFFLLFLVQLNEMRRLGLSNFFVFLFLVLMTCNEEGRRVQDFLLLPQVCESFYSHLPQERWHNLVYVEFLLMIKPMVVGFCSIRAYCYSE